VRLLVERAMRATILVHRLEQVVVAVRVEILIGHL
jgi:hypothetical protein